MLSDTRVYGGVKEKRREKRREGLTRKEKEERRKVIEPKKELFSSLAAAESLTLAHVFFSRPTPLGEQGGT